MPQAEERPFRIYLSPAVRRCAPDDEVAHVNAYLNELTPYLDACGIAWARTPRDATGAEGVRQAVARSNAFHASLHYVVHTNAADGRTRGSRLLVTPTVEGAAFGEAIARHRRVIYPAPVTVTPCGEMYEIVYANAPCVYERLVFHDNAADVAWLHQNWRQLAAQTARALCERAGLPFVDPFSGCK